MSVTKKLIKEYLSPITWWRDENFYLKFYKDNEKEGIIVGHWAEDNSTYEINVPPQLRERILFILNNADQITKENI